MKNSDDDVRLTRPHPRGPEAMGAKCSECPLKNRPTVFGDGDPNAKFAIIGDYPSGKDADRGIPFLARGGETLELMLQKLGLFRKHVWLDNAVMCFPPDGDLKSFLQVQRKLLKDDFRDPVDCCRPRLLTALRVPKCGACHQFLAGPDAERCACKTPIISSKPSVPPVAVLYTGNTGMLALHGTTGITEKRGYTDWNGRPEKRPIPSQSPNGKRLKAKEWLDLYCAPEGGVRGVVKTAKTAPVKAKRKQRA